MGTRGDRGHPRAGPDAGAGGRLGALHPGDPGPVRVPRDRRRRTPAAGGGARGRRSRRTARGCGRSTRRQLTGSSSTTAGASSARSRSSRSPADRSPPAPAAGVPRPAHGADRRRHRPADARRADRAAGRCDVRRRVRRRGRAAARRGLAEGRTAGRAIGYREVAAYLAGELTSTRRASARPNATAGSPGARTRGSAGPRVVWIRYDPELVSRALEAVRASKIGQNAGTAHRQTDLMGDDGTRPAPRAARRGAGRPAPHPRRHGRWRVRLVVPLLPAAVRGRRGATCRDAPPRDARAGRLAVARGAAVTDVAFRRGTSRSRVQPGLLPRLRAPALAAGRGLTGCPRPTASTSTHPRRCGSTPGAPDGQIHSTSWSTTTSTPGRCWTSPSRVPERTTGARCARCAPGRARSRPSRRCSSGQVHTPEVWLAAIRGARPPWTAPTTRRRYWSGGTTGRAAWLDLVRDVDQRGAGTTGSSTRSATHRKLRSRQHPRPRVLATPAHRRPRRRAMLVELGVEVDEGDPINWLRRRSGDSARGDA